MIRPTGVTQDELKDIADTVGREQNNSDIETILGHLENAAVARFDNYITDGPGYSGKVFVVVWPGGPEIVSVLIDSEGGLKLCALDLPGQAIAEEQQLIYCFGGGRGVWGEHPDWPRADWQLEVANNDTSLGYWGWVSGQLNTSGVSSEPDGPDARI